MKKIIIIVVVVIGGLVGLRFLISALEQKGSVNTSVNVVGANENSIKLPDGEWAERDDQTSNAEVFSESNGVLDWADKVREFGFDPQQIAAQESANKLSATGGEQELQKAEEVFPAIAELINPTQSDVLNHPKRRQALARFVQGVSPAIQEIQLTLQQLQDMEMDAALKEEYVRLANEKVKALEKLKEKALSSDPELERLSLTKEL